MEQKKAELKRISVIDEAEIIKNLLVDEQRVKTWLHFSTAQKLLKLKEKEYEDLMNIISIEDDKEMCKAFFEYISVDSNLATNLTAYRFGSTLPNFDLTIIDEAAQCTISGSLPAIARGKRLLLSGDVLQLRPITNVPDPTNLLLMEKHDIRASYDYNKNSILSTMQNVDTISKFLLLTKHFRCHPDIISFSNKKYYHGKLHPVKSRETNRSPLQLYAISNVVVQEKVPKNTNFQEISIIRNLLLKMSVEERLSTSIISPFRAQVALIKDMCDNNDLKVMDIGTVHTFQGKENETIIFSSVINESTPQRTFEWLSNNQELINVAISRAKNKFIFVGNQSEIIARSKQGDDLFELVEYIASRGESIEALTKKGDEHYINSANYKQYNSAKEK